MESISDNQGYLISVVVPVFNGECYLERCIKSLLGQTYRNIEMVFVDDGSSDRSKYIITKYSVEDKRIKYIYQNNQGVSKARNRGISASRGQYLLFVDCDDYISDKMVEQMYQLYIENKCDLVFCGFIYDSKQKKKMQANCDEKIYNKFFDSKVIKCLYDNKIMFAIGTKLYRKDIIEKYHIRFENQKYLEDVNFCLNYLKRCNSIYICNQAFYFYDVTSLNSLNKRNKKENQIEIVLKHVDALYSLFDNISQITNDFYDIYIDRLLSEMKGIYKKNNYSLYKVCKSIILIMDHMKKYALTSASLRHMTPQEEKILNLMIEGRKYKVLFLLLNF